MSKKYVFSPRFFIGYWILTGLNFHSGPFLFSVDLFLFILAEILNNLSGFGGSHGL